MDTYKPKLGDRFYYAIVLYINERTLYFPKDYNAPPKANDTFEIFSYNAEARSKALGAIGAMQHFKSFDLQGPPLKYDKQHYSHSRQFRSNIVDELQYWKQLLNDTKLPIR